jgi:hypothetical protein
MVLAAGALLGGCLSSNSPGGDDPDAGTVLSCGDERTAVAQSNAAIVNGVDTWDPDVVALAEEQRMRSAR